MGPISRDPNNFMDQEHYRMNIARLIESRVASVLGAEIRTEPLIVDHLPVIWSIAVVSSVVSWHDRVLVWRHGCPWAV